MTIRSACGLQVQPAPVRNRGLFLLLVVVGVLIAARLTAQAPQAQAVVIDGGTLIDGNGGAPVPNSVVVIQGN